MRVTEVNRDALARATDDWEDKASISQLMDMNCYINDMRSMYGIQVYPLFDDRAKIVDHNKYLMFLLKWG
jgi:hypothetical protein